MQLHPSTSHALARLLAVLCLPAGAAAQHAASAVISDTPGDELGTSIAAIGDVNGDGVGDYVLGLPGHDQPGLFGTILDESEGRVEVRSGANDALLHFWPATTGTEIDAYSRLGAAVTGLEGGSAWFAAGAPNEQVGTEWPGVVRTFGPFLFSPFSLIETLAGSQNGERFGEVLASMPSTPQFPNGLLAIAAPGYDRPQAFSPDIPDAGRIVLMAPGVATPVLEFRGDYPDGRLGSSLAWIGDQDGDSSPELLVGEPGRGRVYVFGSDGGFPSDPFAAFSGGSSFGSAVRGIGDVTGDGREDLAVGEPNWPYSPEQFEYLAQGAVRAIDSATNAVIYSVVGAESGLQFGSRLEVLDIDADGVLEWASLQGPRDGLSARVRVFEPDSGQERASFLQWAVRFDGGLASPGDLDGDGRDELLLGLPEFEFEAGAAVTVSWDSSGVPGTPATFSVEQDGSGDYASVAEAELFVPPGSILKVGPGDYGDVGLDRELTIVGESAGSLVGRPSLGELAAYGIDRLSLTNLELAGLDVRAVPGRVDLHRLHIEGAGTRLSYCDQVGATALVSVGELDPERNAQAGMLIEDSIVQLSQGTLVGAAGADQSGFDEATPGAPGLWVRGSSAVWLTKTHCGGGQGGDDIGSSAGNPADGAPGLLVRDKSTVDLRGGFLLANATGGQHGVTMTGPTDFAVDIDVEAPAVIELSSLFQTATISDPAQTVSAAELRPILESFGTAEPGGLLEVGVLGDPGQVGVLIISRAPAAATVPTVLHAPVWIDLAKIVSNTVFVVPAGQTAVVSIGIPAIPALIGRVFQGQALTVRPDFALLGSNGIPLPIGF